MTRTRKRLPSPAMIVAIISLVVALTGTAVAAKKLGLGALSNGAKNKTVGVGKLTYVTTTTAIPAALSTAVSAACPGGLTVIGGGIKVTKPYSTGVEASYPTTSGWAGDVYSATATSATTTAICAKAEVTGAPPTS